MNIYFKKLTPSADLTVRKELAKMFLIKGESVSLRDLLERGFFGGKKTSKVSTNSGGTKNTFALFGRFDGKNRYDDTVQVTKTFYEALYTDNERVVQHNQFTTLVYFDGDKVKEKDTPQPQLDLKEGQILVSDSSVRVVYSVEKNNVYNYLYRTRYLGDDKDTYGMGVNVGFDMHRLSKLESKGRLEVGQKYKNINGFIFTIFTIDIRKQELVTDGGRVNNIQDFAALIAFGGLTLVEDEKKKKIKFVKFNIISTESPNIEYPQSTDNWVDFQKLLKKASVPQDDDSSFGYYKTDIVLTDETGVKHAIPQISLAKNENEEGNAPWYVNGSFDPTSESIWEAMPHFMENNDPQKNRETYDFTGPTEGGKKIKNESLHIALMNEFKIEISSLPTDLAADIKEYHELQKNIKEQLKEGEIDEAVNWEAPPNFDVTKKIQAEKDLRNVLFPDVMFLSGEPRDWLKENQIFAKSTENLFGGATYSIHGFSGGNRKIHKVSKPVFDCLLAPYADTIPRDYQPPISRSDKTNYSEQLQAIDDALTLRVWAHSKGIDMKVAPEHTPSVSESNNEDDVENYLKSGLILNFEPSDEVLEFLETWDFVKVTTHKYMTFTLISEKYELTAAFEKIEDEPCIIVFNVGLKTTQLEYDVFRETQKMSIILENR